MVPGLHRARLVLGGFRRVHYAAFSLPRHLNSPGLWPMACSDPAHRVLVVVINRYSLISGAPQGLVVAKDAGLTSPLPPLYLPSIGVGPS